MCKYIYVCVYVFLCTHTHIYTCTFSRILTLVCSTNIKPQDIEYKEKKVYELLMPYNHSCEESVNYEGRKTK